MNLIGKTAIVTGGCIGIGNSISLKLAEYGSNVVIIDNKNITDSKDTLKKIESLGCQSLVYQANVNDFYLAQSIVDEIISRFGKIDILVNNAGINRDSVIWKMTQEQWDEVLDINLKGCFNYIRATANHFKEQCYGKIVNISSINGLRGKFGQANYSASKAGIIGLTKSIAKELGKYSINVNAIAPGLIETEMMKKAPEEVRNNAINEIVLSRIGLPEDVANVVVFLCSELSRHITGEVIKVDGGQYI